MTDNDVSGDLDLASLLPSRNRARLANVIGRRLVDVERIFSLQVDTFAHGGGRDASDFFGKNVGPTRFVFEGGLDLAFAEWGEQLSVILVPVPFEPDIDQQLHRLSESSDPLRRILGGRCSDVRVWTYAEDFESEEARECAISFVLDDPTELFYCTWLHGDMDADYLLPAEEVPLDRAASYRSMSTGETVSATPASLERRVERAVERFRPNDHRHASHAALLKEYLRRSALWAEALDRWDEWPFVDVAGALFPDRATVAADLPLPYLGGAYRVPLQAAVDFAHVAWTARVREIGLPDPFEPLIRLLERGATLTTEHGMIFAGTAGMSRQPFPESSSRWPEVPLDDASLDALDADRE